MFTGGQGTVGPTAVKLCTVPPGPGALVLANLGTASPAYVGMGTNLSTTNGFPIPSGVVPVVIPLFAGSAAQNLYGVIASGAGSVAWLFTTPTGQTGTGTLG
jgi:hypothetical protein